MSLRIIIIVWLLLFVGNGIGVAAEGAGQHHSTLLPFVFQVINFLIFLFVLYKFALPRIRGFFAERSLKIRQSIEEAEAARNAAEQKLRECEKKLEALDKQIQDIRALMKEEGAAEKEKIQKEAQKEAENVASQARIIVDQEIGRAKYELKAELIRLSFEEAEKAINTSITKEDQVRLIREYIKDLTA